MVTIVMVLYHRLLQVPQQLVLLNLQRAVMERLATDGKCRPTMPIGRQ